MIKREYVPETISELTLEDRGHMRTFIISQNKEKTVRPVSLLVTLIVIFTVITFIPLRERLYAQSVLESANPPKAAPEPISADVASFEVKKQNKGEVTEAVKPTEPSTITPPKGIEKSQEPEQVEVPEVVKKAEVKKEKAVANLNYLDGIKITKFSLYAAWGFSTIHHVTIENTNDIAYKDIKIQASYYYSYSTDYGRSETGEVEGNLPITLPPHSKETYLENGTTLQRSSACSMYVASGGIEVLGATPIEETNIQSSRRDELLLEFTEDGLFLVR